MVEVIIPVHDHSRPCEHGSLWPHWISVRDAKWWQEPECLGGVAMTLRRVGLSEWEQIDGEAAGPPSSKRNQ